MRARTLIFLCYLILTGFLCFHHEPWRDEVDSWLMSRDSSLISSLKTSPNAGTPVLWYFLLKPFATNGFPFYSQKILNWIITSAATALIIFQSPFSILALIAMCSSWFLSFEYSVVARNYGIGLLGLFLLLGSWSFPKNSLKRRIQYFTAWPLLCFSSVHFLSWVPGLLFLEFTNEKSNLKTKKQLLCLIWPAFLFTLSVILLWPTGNGQMSDSFVSSVNPHLGFKAMAQGVFPFFDYKGIAVVIAPVLILGFIKKTNPHKTQRWLVYFMLAFVNGIFIFKFFQPYLRYSGFNWLILVVSAWVGIQSVSHESTLVKRELSSKVTYFFVALFLINAPDIFKHWLKEIRFPFTDAYKTARFLEASGLVNHPISCFDEPNCSAILGYLNQKKQFWYPGTKRWGTHMWWDKNYADGLKLGFEDAFVSAYNFFSTQGSHTDFVYISRKPIQSPEKYGFKLVFSDKIEGWRQTDEAFNVYHR